MVGDQVYTRGGAGCSPRPLGSRWRGGLRESVRRWLAVAFPYPHRCSLDARGSGGQSRARAGAVTTGPLLQLLLAGADLRVCRAAVFISGVGCSLRPLGQERRTEQT
jgi:hypothetical protein